MHRSFVEDYANITAPLTDALRADQTWSGDAKQVEAFNKIRDKIIQNNYVYLPDLSLPIHVDTDASAVGIGATVYQINQEKKIRVLRYLSRKHTAAMLGRPVFYQEAYAIVEEIAVLHIDVTVSDFSTH